MTMNTENSVYTDIQGLARLRNKAATDAPAALKEVGKQFEALFLQMMLKSMRDATPGDPLFGSQEANTYRDLFDKQISENLSARGGLGLAEIVVRQLQPRVAPAAAADSGSPAASAAVATGDSASASPAAFVKTLWPEATRAAKALGVAPEVLVAQAALETGWGRDVMRGPDGQSSNNLFGIKAGGDWQGASVEVPTVEHRDGVAVNQRAAFRAYDSTAASFHDYVKFIQAHPRYREALAQAGDAQGYTQALQQAGYATDPNYAGKIQGVLGSRTMVEAMAGLKGGTTAPLS